MAGIVTETAGVDQRLGMLYAEADGKRLGLNINAAVIKHFEGVPRAVTAGQHDVIAEDRFAVGELNPMNLPVIDNNIVHAALKAYFAAQ